MKKMISIKTWLAILIMGAVVGPMSMPLPLVPAQSAGM